MKCPICGVENIEDSKFCNQCGNPMSYEPDEKVDFRDSTIPMRAITEEDLENVKTDDENISEDKIEDIGEAEEIEKIKETEEVLVDSIDDNSDNGEYYEDEYIEEEYNDDIYEDDEVEILNTNSNGKSNGKYRELLSKRSSVIIGVTGISVILVLLVVAFSSAFGLPINKFKRAFDAGRYDEAIEIYNDVKAKDSWEDIKKSFADYINDEVDDIIAAYTKDKINSEEAEEKLGYIKSFGDLIDYNKVNSNYETLKADKENYKLAKEYIDKNEYINAMNALRNISDKSKDKAKRDELISSIEGKYIDEIIKKTNNLAKENKYDEALKVLEEASKYYKSNEDLTKQTSDIKKQKEEYEKKNKKNKEDEKNDLLEFFNKIVDKATGAISYKPNEFKKKFSIPFRGASIMPYIDGDVGDNSLRLMVGINRFKEFNINKITAVTNKGEEEIAFNINSRENDGKFLGNDEWVDIPISKTEARDYRNIGILENLANSDKSIIKIKGKSEEVEYKLTSKDKENILKCIKLHNM